MIELRAPLEIQAGADGGWELVFWVLDAFDDTTPFRAMLAEIALALGQDAQTDLHLPGHEPNEDFITGTLRFGEVALRVYYEHSLSYLSLMSEDEAVLREAARRIEPHVAIVP